MKNCKQLKSIICRFFSCLLVLALMTASAADSGIDPSDSETHTSFVTDSDTTVETEEEPEIVYPDYVEESVGTKNTLTGVRESITLDLVDGALCVTDLSTASNPTSKLKENSLYQVIKKTVTGSERIAMQEFFAERYVYEYQATERKFFFF